jgi:hypothetical protein
MNLIIQQNLVDYVKSGGTLFIVPEIPYMDENFEPCTVFADYIGVKTTEYFASDYDVNVCDLPGITNNKLWKCDIIPENAQVFAYDEISKTVLGWKHGYPGGGTVMWLGVRWRHEKLILNRMMRSLFDLLDVTSTAVECDNPNVWAVLRVNGGFRMLFLMNLFSSPLEAGVKIKNTNGSYTDLGKHKLTAMEVKAVRV